MNKHTLASLSFVLSIGALSSCGTSPTATANGVSPANGFAGRSLRVQVSGDNTKWKDGATTVDFGMGITVTGVTVSSPTDLFADITIDPSAAAGMHDVTITGGGTYKLAQAFEIDSPVDIAIDGTVAQGSVPSFTITNHDFENPFDATQDPMTQAYTNLMITGSAGAAFVISTVTDRQITGLIEIDVDAAAGMAPVTIKSGPSTAQVTSIPATQLNVAARTATALTSGTTASGMLTVAHDSKLFSLSAASPPSLFQFSIPPPTNPNAQPFAILLGPSGHWSDFAGSNLVQSFFGVVPVAAFTTVAGKSGPYYLIYFDGGTAAGYNFTLKGTNTAFTVVAEGTEGAHATQNTALAASALPYLYSPASMSTMTDQDWLKFTTGTVGKKVHVQMYNPDPQTEVGVEVLDGSNCGNSLNATAGTAAPLDSLTDYISSTALTNATFCVKMTAFPGDTTNGIPAWSAGHTAYGAAIWLE